MSLTGFRQKCLGWGRSANTTGANTTGGMLFQLWCGCTYPRRSLPLAMSLTELTGLERLELSSCGDAVSVNVLVQIIRSTPHLQHFGLKGMAFSQVGWTGCGLADVSVRVVCASSACFSPFVN